MSDETKSNLYFGILLMLYTFISFGTGWEVGKTQSRISLPNLTSSDTVASSTYDFNHFITSTMELDMENSTSTEIKMERIAEEISSQDNYTYKFYLKSANKKFMNQRVVFYLKNGKIFKTNFKQLNDWLETK